MRRSWILFTASALCLMATTANAAEPAARLRHPVSLVVSQDGKWLYTANERAGSISAIELEAGAVRSETEVSPQLSCLARLDERRVLAVSGSKHELVLVDCQGEKVRPLANAAVAKYPVQVAVMPDQKTAVVTSLWSRRVTLVECSAEPPSLKVAATLDLNFAPHSVVALDKQHALVADAFAGQLTVIDTAAKKIARTLTIDAHNIRGLVQSPDGFQVFVSHTLLNEYAEAFHSDITWGVLTVNSVHAFPVASLLAGDDLKKVSELKQLGVPGQGGADPAGVVIGAQGVAVVALSGARQVAFCTPDDIKVERVPAGAYPTAVALSPDSFRAYVANTHDDTIGVYDVIEARKLREIILGPQPTLTAAERGERLFHDGRLAHDRWMTCHTCHTNGHSNGAVNDNFTDGSFGAAKRVPSLLGCRDTGPYAWNGKTPSLEEQMKTSISSTMQGKYRVPDDQAADLATYLRTLEAPPPLAAAREDVKADVVARGQALFHAHGCKSCHAPPHYTTPETYDVGLVDKLGGHEFNPPSLRGVSQRPHLFHDNRATSVEEVIVKFKHQLDRDLSATEAADLAAFLRSL